MKKVLLVVPFLEGGGAERVVSIWCNELAKLGYDTNLLVFYRKENEYYLDNKVNIHVLARNKEDYDGIGKFHKIKLIRAKIKEINPYVVITFIYYVGIMTSIAMIGLPNKLINTVRNSPEHIPVKKIYRCIRNISIILSDFCIVQNENQLKYFSKHLQKKMMIIPNPIAQEFVNKKRQNNKIINKVVAIGRLEKQKNFEMLINSFSDVLKEKELTLDIYGEGSLHKKLNRQIIDLGLEGKIKLHGRVNNVCDVLIKSDLFILTSNNEGMPNALMEAMALGLPCISTDCPTGPSDLIKNRINGILIEVNDRQDLSRNILELVENKEYAFKLGFKARESILSNYSPEINIKHLVECIETKI